MSLRLEILERGHATPKRTLIRVVERVGRVRMDDVVRVSLYRPRFFGRAWLRFVRSVMRGPSRWTPGERELLAAFTSWLNRCPFCVGIHTRTAALGLSRQVDVAMLEHWRDTPLDPRMRAAFELLEKRAADPGSLTPADFATARLNGLGDEALADLLYIAFLFDVINRLANVFGFTTVDDAGRRKTAAILHRMGYRVPGFLLQ